MKMQVRPMDGEQFAIKSPIDGNDEDKKKEEEEAEEGFLPGLPFPEFLAGGGDAVDQAALLFRS
jgi:hypothetical protein